MSITTITTDNFEEEILKSDKTALVDFYADWCGPCQMMSPIIDEISEELTDVKFGKVNIDDYPEIAANYGIMSIPTLLIFKNGELNNTFVGVTAKDKILDEMNEILKTCTRKNVVKDTIVKVLIYIHNLQEVNL